MPLYKLYILLLSLVLAVITPAALAIDDHFDDGVIGPEWIIGGSPLETGTLLVSVNGDSITSQTTMTEGAILFGLRNLYDSRNLADYTKYTLGYAGLYAGTQYVLIRNDNQGGGVLAVEVYKGGNTYTLGTISIGNSQTHNMDVYITWSATEMKVIVDDLATAGMEAVIVETNPAKIPDLAMAFTNYASQVNSATWDLDFVKTGTIGSDSFSDHFDDSVINANLWGTVGTPVESGTIVACDGGDDIFSKGRVFYGPIHFVLQGVFDSRNQANYSKYTLGYSGLYAGSQYVLIRNDNQAGGVLRVQIWKNSTLTSLSTVSVGDGQPHDIDVYMLWDAAKLTIVADNVDSPGIDLLYETTNASLIPDVPMNFIHHGNQTLAATWNVDYAAAEGLQSVALDDHFDNNSIDTAAWRISGTPVEHGTVLSGDAGGDGITSKGFVAYDKVRFGIRNFYDNRANLDYSKYTLGYTGLLASKYILARNDIGLYAGGLSVEVYPRYGYSYQACRLNTSNGQTHDIDVFIDWRPDYLHIEMDDLNNGVGADSSFTTTDANEIPQEPMSFTHYTNTVLNAAYDLDYVFTGDMCGDTGYLPEDLSRDCYVNMKDVNLFAQDWLNCNILGNPQCPPFVPQDDSSAGITVYTAVPGTATIDGNLADWATNAAWTPISKVYDGMVIGASDAMFACRYDAATDIIYCAVKITDTDRVFNPGNFGWNQQDDLEIYVKGDANATGNVFGVWDKAQQYVVGYDGFGSTWAEWPDSQPTNTTSPDPGLIAAAAIDGNNIIYEFSCKAWDNYTGKGGSGTSAVADLYAGKMVGFDVVLGVKSAGNFGMLCPNTRVSKAYDISLYGTLKCTAGGWASYLDADLTQDNRVNFADFARLANVWFECNNPADPTCNP